MRTRTFRLLYLIIIVFAVVIRLLGLDRIPAGIYWDEAAILADAKKVAVTGTDMHSLSPWHLIYPSYGDYKLAPYIWATTLSVQIFGVNYFALRFPSALAGVLTVILAGGLARLLGQHTFASRRPRDLWQLATMFAVAITPWSLLFSRTGFEGHLGQMFLALAAYLLVLSWQPKNLPPQKSRLVNLFLIVSSGFVGGFAFWTYFSVRFVWPFVASFIGLYFLLHTRQWRRFLVSSVLVAVCFLLMMFPMSHDPLYATSNQLRLSTPSILNDPELPHLVNEARRISGNNLFSRIVFNQKFTQAQQLLANYSRHLDFGYLYLHGDENLRHSTGFTGVFLLVCFPFVLLGLIYLFRRDWPLFCLFFGWWLIGLLPASVPTLSVPHALRSLNSLVPATLIIGFGLTIFIQYILHAKYQSKSIKLYKYCLGTFVTLSFVFSSGRFIWYYWHVYPATAAAAFESSNDHLVDILVAESEHYKQVYAVELDRFLYLWYINRPEFDAHDLDTRYLSENYAYHDLGKINFDLTSVVPSEGQLFFLGETAKIEALLDRLSYTDRRDLYHFTEYGVDYLGTEVTLIPDPDLSP